MFNMCYICSSVKQENMRVVCVGEYPCLHIFVSLFCFFGFLIFWVTTVSANETERTRQACKDGC